MSLEPVVALILVSVPPVSKYVLEHPGVTASDSTRYQREGAQWHKAALLWALGTPLIIYPACVYLCWSRLCGGGGWEKGSRQNPARRSVRSSQIQRDWLRLHVVCVYVCVSETRVAAVHSCQHELGSDLDTHTKHLIAKKGLSRAPLCLMCSTLILPFGDICCCVNYTPPGALIITHTNIHIVYTS